MRWLLLGGTLLFLGCQNNTATEEQVHLSRKLNVLVTTRENVRCEPGLKAFTETVHKWIRKDCVQCHDAGKMGPPHSVEDPAKSYAAVLAYMNFDDLGNSRFVTKGGNQHCLEHDGNCLSLPSDML